MKGKIFKIFTFVLGLAGGFIVGFFVVKLVLEIYKKAALKFAISCEAVLVKFPLISIEVTIG